MTFLTTALEDIPQILIQFTYAIVKQDFNWVVIFSILVSASSLWAKVVRKLLIIAFGGEEDQYDYFQMDDAASTNPIGASESELIVNRDAHSRTN